MFRNFEGIDLIETCADYSADLVETELRERTRDALAAVEEDKYVYSTYNVVLIVLRFLVVVLATVGSALYFFTQQYRYARTKQFGSVVEMLRKIMIFELSISVCLFLSSILPIVYATVLLGQRDLFSYRTAQHM